jgi:hypothetical protein
MTTIMVNGEEYTVDMDSPSKIEDMVVGDLIFMETIQNLNVKLVVTLLEEPMESHSNSRGTQHITVRLEERMKDEFSLTVGNTYSMYANKDLFYKLEPADIPNDALRTSLRILIGSKKKEFWTTRDNTILYPNQMDDEQLAKLYVFINKNTQQMRKELAKKDRDILGGMGFRVPVSDTSSVTDKDWAINNIAIYKLLLDEISHRQLNMEVYEEKPKAKLRSQSKMKYSYNLAF